VRVFVTGGTGAIGGPPCPRSSVTVPT